MGFTMAEKKITVKAAPSLSANGPADSYFVTTHAPIYGAIVLLDTPHIVYKRKPKSQYMLYKWY
jgi:hypothetical protein